MRIREKPHADAVTVDEITEVPLRVHYHRSIMARTAPPSTRELNSQTAVKPAGSVPNSSSEPEATLPSQEEIAQLAYSFWLERGDANGGSAEDDWFRAERELRERKYSRG
jgi:Protein of unknown function (DUF2934)